MKAAQEKFDPAKLDRLFARAIAAGTHTPRSKHLCEGCREFVDGIYHVNEQGKRFCADCADKAGVGPKAWEKRQAALAGGKR